MKRTFGWLIGVSFLLLSTPIVGQEFSSEFLQGLQGGHRDALQNYGYRTDEKEFKIDVVGNHFFSICYGRHEGSFFTAEGERSYFIHVQGLFSSQRDYHQERKFIIVQKIKTNQILISLKWTLLYNNGPEDFTIALLYDEAGSDAGTIDWQKYWTQLHADVQWWKISAWTSECRTDWRCYILKAADIGMLLIRAYFKSQLQASTPK